MQREARSRLSPAVLISGVLGTCVVVVAAVAVVAATAGGSRSDAATAATGASATAERPRARLSDLEPKPEADAIHTRMRQIAAQAESPLEVMAPLYEPAIVTVELQQAGEDHEQASSAVTGFFIGPGKVAAPRSAVFGSNAATIVYNGGQRFPVNRVIFEDETTDLVLLSVQVPSELLRGLRVAPLEPFPGRKLLVLGAAEDPGAETPTHPNAVLEVQRVRVNEKGIDIVPAEPLPEWSLGAPAIDEDGRLAGFVSRGGDGSTRIAGAEVLVRKDPLPGLTLAAWSAGTSVASTKPPPESEDLWAEIRNLPRPAGFGPAPEEFAGYRIRPAKIDRTGDGLRIDDRFTVTGSGTADDPYIVPWDLFVSANETFNPSRGKLVLPERVTMFDGTWVQLQGNLAIPFAERQVTEVLLMQHPWDGCCLGVPPSPYDAVEVALAAPILTRPQYGLVTGTLDVDPFVRGEWLFGMYVLDGAKLSMPVDEEADR
ncbi:MAG: hypothetical protein AAFX79_01290 [Planctomycetota bacterium]